MDKHESIASMTSAQLRERAEGYREMAKTATTEQTGLALLRLADQFDELALKRSQIEISELKRA